jgi:hypothetical protein
MTALPARDDTDPTLIADRIAALQRDLMALRDSVACVQVDNMRMFDEVERIKAALADTARAPACPAD